jgi:signal transduction histidine kinase
VTDEPTSAVRYVEVNRRMNLVNGAGAGLITLLMLVSVWGSWRIVAVVALTQVAVIAFNTVLVNNVLLVRWGIQRGEIARAVVNLSTGVALNHYAHWPLAGWLLLPYVALAFDHLGPRVARSVVVSMCVAQDLFALHDGVSWQYPLVFTVAACFCSVVGDVRFRVIRAMLVDADQQRRAVALAHDETKREVAARRAVEEDLRRAQKLESVGRLAAGVAHEINTPLQFVGDNLTFLDSSVKSLSEHYTRVRAMVSAPVIAELERAADVDFLAHEMPQAITTSLEGVAHVSRIVRALRALTHIESSDAPASFDLDAAIRDVVMVVQGETKYVADVIVEPGDVTSIVGLQGEVKQVLLNLLVNAAHAVADGGKHKRGKIVVRSRREGAWAVVEVEDDGVGIPESARPVVFDPFFTTKEVGRGTGQGLAIARNIVVNKHGGELTFETELGHGTTFSMRLPLDGREVQAA